jgi:predicted peptidase
MVCVPPARRVFGRSENDYILDAMAPIVNRTVAYCFGILLITLAGLAGCASSPAHTASHARGFLFGAVEVDGRTYHSVIYVPRDLVEPAPLILFLHGRGECGTDGQRQLAVGLGPRVLWNPEMYPAVILMPQKPDERQWEEHVEAVRIMLRRTMESFPIDPARVSLTGLSQGGHGVWTINALLPEMFSALAPICGYVDVTPGYDPASDAPLSQQSELMRAVVEGAKDTPVWIFHGARDTVVPASASTQIAEFLRQQGADVRLTIYPEANHNSWDAAYGDPALGAWLIGHRRANAHGSH